MFMFPLKDLAWHVNVLTMSYISNIYDRHIDVLTHWDQVTYICVGKLNIFGLDNDLSLKRSKAVI